MNKKLSVLFLLPILGIAACSNGSKSPINKQGDVLKGDVLKYNVNAQYNIDANRLDGSKTEFSVTSEDTVAIENLLSATPLTGNRYLTIKTSDGKTGIYDTRAMAWRVEPIIMNSDPTYNSSHRTYIVYSTKDEDEPVVYHYLDIRSGEEVFTTEDPLGTYSLMDYTYLGVDYILASYSFNNDKALYYSMNKETKEVQWAVNRYPFIPEAEAGKYQTVLSNNGTVIDLARYGHKGYQLFFNTKHIYVLNDKGKRISSFEAPSQVNPVVIGDYYIYQVKKAVPETFEKYDYVDQGVKYVVETTAVNYLNGKSDKLSLNYLFLTTNRESIFNKKGVYKYVRSDVTLINKNKTLDKTNRNFIIDEKCVLHDDLTSVSKMRDIYVFGNYYWDSNTQKVFDKNLKVKFYVNQNVINTYLKSEDVGLVKTNSGLYGLVDSENKVLLQPKYAMVDTDAYDGYSLLVEDVEGKQCIIKKNGEVILDCSEYDSVDYFACGYYTLVKDGVTSFFVARTGDKIARPDVHDGYTLVSDIYDYDSAALLDVRGQIYINTTEGKLQLIRQNIQNHLADVKK